MIRSIWSTPEKAGDLGRVQGKIIKVLLDEGVATTKDARYILISLIRNMLIGDEDLRKFMREFTGLEL